VGQVTLRKSCTDSQRHQQWSTLTQQTTCLQLLREAIKIKRYLKKRFVVAE